METWVATDACTLPTAEQPLRVAEFDELFRTDLAEVRPESGTRIVLVFRDRPGLEAAIADLVARESACCSFFTFGQAREAAGLVLTIDVPASRTDVLAGLAARAELHVTGAAR